MPPNTYRTIRTGFTLIELLVVVAIIGLLSSIVLASISDARSSALDARRAADLKQIQTALEQYAIDNGTYPCENRSRCPGQSVNANGRIGEGSGLDTLLSPYLPNIPVDPQGPGNSSFYYYYDARQVCNGGEDPLVAVVFARNLGSGNGNGADFCTSWGGEGGAGQPGALHVIVGVSPDA